MIIITQELDHIIGVFLNFAIIAVFALSSYLNIEYYIKTPVTVHEQQWRWIKLFYGLISVAWVCIYVFIQFFSHVDPSQPSWIGVVLVRPLIFATGAIIASAAISRKKTREQNGQPKS